MKAFYEGFHVEARGFRLAGIDLCCNRCGTALTPLHVWNVRVGLYYHDEEHPTSKGQLADLSRMLGRKQAAKAEPTGQQAPREATANRPFEVMRSTRHRSHGTQCAHQNQHSNSAS